MSSETYNEEQALANHTAKSHQISKLIGAIERRDKRIKDQAGMITWLQARVSQLETELSPQGQAEKVFSNGE